MDKPMINDGINIDFGTQSFHIDERLEKILGHYRKYFDDVPLPNCDSVRFGRYGSFLPDCQHSPCNSPLRDISQHVPSFNVSKSPQTVPKNKHIHRSLGLDTSSSEGDSPICRRGGLLVGSAVEHTASPSCIIESMTTPPILEDTFLSPLPDSLIFFAETTRKVDIHSCGSVSRSSSPLIGDNGNENLSGKKKRKLVKKRQNCLDTFHSNNSYILTNSSAKSMACCRKIHNMETSSQVISLSKNQAKLMPNEGENIRLPEIFEAENPPAEASVLSKDGNYANAVKISPSRSAASCLISSPRECLELQDICISNPCEVLHMKNSSPVEEQKLTDEAKKPIREANSLKLCANGLKSSGLRIESTEIFFQAALKYLDAASLFETHVSGNAVNVALTPVKIYDTTAKLLEYCAQEYESCKDMALAALAYKCLEASNMQIVYSTDCKARRVCQELQVSLLSLTSGITSPVSNASNGYIQNRSMFVQLLNFTQCANSAMEASRKSRITFDYASKILEETGSSEVVDCMKRALNYGFHDMKKLLHLVHEAMEALSS